MSANLTEVVQRFRARYRLGLLRKAGLLAVLGAGILALAGWRVHELRLGPAWSIGVPAGLWLAAAAGLVWWVSRQWMSRRGSAAHLDRALDLQQRLITAEEFAGAEPPPALYPLLVEDASRRCTLAGARFPRPVTRATVALAVLLLVLLLWPVRGRVPLQQLARPPQATPPVQPPEMPPPPDAPRDEPQQRRTQQAGGSAQQQPGEGRESAQSSEREQSSGQSQQAGDPSQHPGSEGETQPADQQGGSARQTGTEGGQKPDAERRQTGQDGSQEGRAGAQGSARESAQAQPGGGSQEGSGGQSAGDQAALKAKIQELLKEVSGELKQLQAQLAVAHPETAPDAGTSTDPELYEAPTPIGPDTGPPLPMSLGTDTAATKTPRPGGGVGAPSDTVSSDAPSTLPEEAELSEAPLAERAAGRQVVPPEYRGVFERLHRDRTSPEAAP